MINRTEQDIMKNWQGDATVPVVSICTITYNHEAFVAEALDSFLMQETDFPFEIVIDDDCSPDGTAEVINQYIKQFPNIIKANLREKNVGMMPNFTENMKRAKGKYIALCEGDDYWTDPLKLQKQVDFLRDNIDTTMIFENAKIVNEKNTTSLELFNPKEVASKFVEPIDLIQAKRIVPTGSILFCRDDAIVDFFVNNSVLLVGDTPLFLYLAKSGKIYYNNNISSIYRVHVGGVTSLSFHTLETNKKFMAYYVFIQEYFKDLKLDKIMNERRASRYYQQAVIYKTNAQYTNMFKALFSMFVKNPKMFFNYVIKKNYDDGHI